MNQALTGPRPKLAATEFYEEELYEIVNGRRVIKPTSQYAARIGFLIAIGLDEFGERGQLGQAGVQYLFRLDEKAKLERRPDAAFISFKRWPKVWPLPYTDSWPVIPDLAVEVISPGSLAQ